MQNKVSYLCLGWLHASQTNSEGRFAASMSRVDVGHSLFCVGLLDQVS